MKCCFIFTTAYLEDEVFAVLMGSVTCSHSESDVDK